LIYTNYTRVITEIKLIRINAEMTHIHMYMFDTFHNVFTPYSQLN